MGELQLLLVDRIVSTAWRLRRSISLEDGHVVLLVGKRNRAHRIPLGGIKRARLEVDF